MIPADSRGTEEPPPIREVSPERARLLRRHRHNERYGAGHQRRRRQWAARLRGGEEVFCCRCGGVIGDDQLWDLDHDDVNPALELPAHRWCNRGAHRLRTSRDW